VATISPQLPAVDPRAQDAALARAGQADGVCGQARGLREVRTWGRSDVSSTPPGSSAAVGRMQSQA
jgi:hypothetical protein